MKIKEEYKDVSISGRNIKYIKVIDIKERDFPFYSKMGFANLFEEKPKVKSIKTKKKVTKTKKD